jgi:hypothetical protein
MLWTAKQRGVEARFLDVIERIMRGSRALLVCAWLAGCSVGGAQDEPLAFAGFHRDMDLAALLDRYPQSTHEVYVGIRNPDGGLEGIRKFFRTRGSSGTYILRICPDELHDHLYYVQAWVREGATERLWLLLETPLDLMNPRQISRGMGARHPACNEVLGPLIAKYGKPVALAPIWEEDLESFYYVWTRPPEVMKLECGRSGRKFFAIGVTLDQTAPR